MRDDHTATGRYAGHSVAQGLPVGRIDLRAVLPADAHDHVRYADVGREITEHPSRGGLVDLEGVAAGRARVVLVDRAAHRDDRDLRLRRGHYRGLRRG